MFRLQWRPALTKAQLDAQVNPVSPSQPEVVPWFLFDTQSVSATQAAGSTITFFTTTNSDPTMSNMEGSGQLPDPQYMVVDLVTCDILQVPTTTAQASQPAGAWNNVDSILKLARTTFTLSVSNKSYGTFPLTLCHATGGVTGFGYSAATAGGEVQYANNGIVGSGGFPYGGALIIPPKTGFKLVLNFGTLLANTAAVNVRLGLAGVLYRRVL